MTTKDCLELILEPMSNSFSIEFARQLSSFQASRELQHRVDELAEKANEGTLTAAEATEYQSLIAASTIVAMLQSKARQFLARRAT